MNNIDDWLSSLGINESERPSPMPPVSLDSAPLLEPAIVSEEPVVQSLSEDDFNDILSDLGFQESQDSQDIQEAEEVGEEEGTTEEIIDSTFQPQSIIERDISILLENSEGVTISETPFHNAAQLMANTNEDIAAVSLASPEENTPLIPINSPTLLVDETTSRFSGTEWYRQIQSARVILAGLGGIGSNAALQIARLHPHDLILYDDDRVERGNMSGQLFGNKHVGNYKTDSVGDVLYEFTNFCSFRCVRQKWTEASTAGDIMICGFDNMEARKIFFNSWWRHLLELSEERRKACLFIDGRLSIDTLQVLCIQGNDTNNMERYRREFLFSDAEADETVCSMKQTTYMACMIGAVITNLFTNFIAETLDPVIPYDLPFFTEYNAQYMYFKTEH